MEKRAQYLIPMQTVSEANKSEHWSKKHKRHKTQKWQIRCAFSTHMPKVQLPALVKLIRISPRSLDDDNLTSAFKWIRDEIGAKLTGDDRPGRGDGDPRIKWMYDQEKGQQAVRIEIYQI